MPSDIYCPDACTPVSGDSSKPRTDNAIYALANALHRLETYRFTPMMNPTTRAYFSGREKSEKGALGDAMRAWLRNPKDGRAADAIEGDEGETGIRARVAWPRACSRPCRQRLAATGHRDR